MHKTIAIFTFAILFFLFFSQYSHAQQTTESNEVKTRVGNPVDSPGNTTTAPPTNDLTASIQNEFGLQMIGAWDQKHLQWLYESYYEIKQTNPKFIQLINGEPVHLCDASCGGHGVPNQLAGYVRMQQIGSYANDKGYFMVTLTHELGHAMYHHKSDTLTLRTAINNQWSKTGGFSSYAPKDMSENYAEVIANCIHGKPVGRSPNFGLWPPYKPLAEQALGACRQ